MYGSVSAQGMGASLVPPSSATDTAKKSGSWQDASTWTDGTVPTIADRVLIPAGLTVTNHSTAEALWIHVAGTLACCDHCDTQINVHTIYVPMGGSVRLHSTGKCVVEFLPGPFLPGDTTQLSRGLICHGMLMASGNAKLHGCAVADSLLAAGATTLHTASVPSGWQVGDTLVIAGTDSHYYTTPPSIYESEIVTITAVADQTVTFSPPLKYKHFRWRADVPFHVLNTTRNVVFRSRDPVSNRGHLMHMGSMTNDMRYVAVEGCGRTDGSRPVTDPRFDVYGEMVPGSDSNVRARYADHWHRRGQLSVPAIRIGCVCDGITTTNKWGFLIHDSVAHLKDCIALRFNGSGFATEEGQERGSIEGCFSCLNKGKGATETSTDADHANALNGLPNGDWGVDGSGFWMQGGSVQLRNNVAFDNSGRGFGLFNRTLNGYPNYGTGNPIPDYLRYPIETHGTLLPLAYNGIAATPASTVPMQVFDGCTAYGNKLGVQSWTGPTHDSSSNLIWPLAVRGNITNLTLWGRGGKLHLEYTRQMNVDGLTIVGDGLFRTDGQISRSAEWVVMRNPEVTVRNWSIAGVLGAKFRVVGANDPGGIAAKNISIQGATVNADGSVSIP